MSAESKSNAYKMLEMIQKRYLALKGLDHPGKLGKTKIESVIKGVMGEINETDVSEVYSALKEHTDSLVLNTKYQDPYFYDILNNIIRDLEGIKKDIFKGMDLNIEMPCFGSVDYDIFSAEICAPDCNEKLIIISDGLFTFANLISKVIAQVFPLKEMDSEQSFSVDIDNVQRQIENNKEIKLRFYDLMLACLITGEPPRARQYFIEFRLNWLLEIIRNSFETFVVAHEYSHSILGHLEDKRINSTSKIDELKDCEFEKIVHSWEEEIEADLYGVIMTLAVMGKKGVDRYMTMMGIIVCMNSLELFDRIEMLRSGNSTDRKMSRSHPPGWVREALVVQKYFDGEEVCLFKTVDTIFSNLWEDFENFFKKLSHMIENATSMNIYEIPFEVTQSILYNIIMDAKL